MKLTGLALFCATLIHFARGYVNPEFCGSFNLQTQYQWSNLKFAIPEGYYVDPSYTPNNTHITGLEEAGGVFYLSTPRLKGYNPATLATIPRNISNAGTSSPVLQPYPDISWHHLPTDGYTIDCNATLVSVHRTQVDGCNRLWVLDSGTINVLRNTTRICPAKIVVFNLATNRVEKLIIIPKDVLRPDSVLTYLVLDNIISPSGSSPNSSSSQWDWTTDSCDNMFVYISSRFPPAVIVYNSKADQFYRISSPYMYPDPKYPFLQLYGRTFTVFVGVVGMTVAGSGRARALYFQPIASLYIYTIPTSFLQAGPYTGDASNIPVSRTVYKSSGGVGLNTDPESACIYYNQISQNTINTYSTTTKTTRIAASSQQIAVIFDFAISSENVKQKFAVSVNLLQYYQQNQSIDQKIFSLTNL